MRWRGKLWKLLPLLSAGFRVWGLGFTVLGFKVFGFRVLGFRVLRLEWFHRHNSWYHYILL